MQDRLESFRTCSDCARLWNTEIWFIWLRKLEIEFATKPRSSLSADSGHIVVW